MDAQARRRRAWEALQQLAAVPAGPSPSCSSGTGQSSRLASQPASGRGLQSLQDKQWESGFEQDVEELENAFEVRKRRRRVSGPKVKPKGEVVVLGRVEEDEMEDCEVLWGKFSSSGKVMGLEEKSERLPLSRELAELAAMEPDRVEERRTTKMPDIVVVQSDGSSCDDEDLKMESKVFQKPLVSSSPASERIPSWMEDVDLAAMSPSVSARDVLSGRGTSSSGRIMRSSRRRPKPGGLLSKLVEELRRSQSSSVVKRLDMNMSSQSSDHSKNVSSNVYEILTASSYKSFSGVVIAECSSENSDALGKTCTLIFHRSCARRSSSLKRGAVIRVTSSAERRDAVLVWAFDILKEPPCDDEVVELFPSLQQQKDLEIIRNWQNMIFNSEAVREHISHTESLRIEHHAPRRAELKITGRVVRVYEAVEEVRPAAMLIEDEIRRRYCRILLKGASIGSVLVGSKMTVTDVERQSMKKAYCPRQTIQGASTMFEHVARKSTFGCECVGPIELFETSLDSQIIESQPIHSLESQLEDIISLATILQCGERKMRRVSFQAEVKLIKSCENITFEPTLIEALYITDASLNEGETDVTSLRLQLFDALRLHSTSLQKANCHAGAVFLFQDVKVGWNHEHFPELSLDPWSKCISQSFEGDFVPNFHYLPLEPTISEAMLFHGIFETRGTITNLLPLRHAYKYRFCGIECSRSPLSTEVARCSFCNDAECYPIATSVLRIVVDNGAQAAVIELDQSQVSLPPELFTNFKGTNPTTELRHHLISTSLHLRCILSNTFLNPESPLFQALPTSLQPTHLPPLPTLLHQLNSLL